MKSASKAFLFAEESSHQVEEKPLKISAGFELLCLFIITSADVRAWLREEDYPFLFESNEELLFIEELLAHAALLDHNSLAVFLSQLPNPLQRLISSWDLERSIPDPLEKAKDTWNGLRVAYWKQRQAAMTALLKKMKRSIASLLRKQIKEASG